MASISSSGIEQPQRPLIVIMRTKTVAISDARPFKRSATSTSPEKRMKGAELPGRGEEGNLDDKAKF
jgi:hypothetical protein